MILKPANIKRSSQKLNRSFESIAQRCNIFYLGSDPTRLKILTLLREHEELCVSDISKIINVSISAISHQLSLLEKCHLVRGAKKGKRVCYSLDTKGPGNNLLRLIA